MGHRGGPDHRRRCLCRFPHKRHPGVRESYYVDNYRSASAALSSDLRKHPAPVVITPNWAAVGFSYYATPAALAHALVSQASQALDRHLIDWQEVLPNSAPGGSLPHSSVLHWPAGVTSVTRQGQCPVGWAIGRGNASSRAFRIDGSRCRLTRVRYYGEAWVASVGGQ